MDKKHLMRMFALNSGLIFTMHASIAQQKHDARWYFAYGRNIDYAKSILREVAKDKSVLARLVETQKAIKAELRSGKRSTKKHGTKDIRYLLWHEQNGGPTVAEALKNLK